MRKKSVPEPIKVHGLNEEQLKDPEMLKLINQRIKELNEEASRMEVHGSLLDAAREIEVYRLILNTLIEVKVACEAFQILGDKI